MLKIAVVTPYNKENDDILRQCHVSVLRQSYPCTHILVADGHPKSLFDEPKTMHVILPQANGDMGNTPRAIGGILADAYGFDAVAYLDADNWYDPSHIEGLITAHEANDQPKYPGEARGRAADGSLRHSTKAESVSKAASILQMNDPYPPNG